MPRRERCGAGASRWCRHSRARRETTCSGDGAKGHRSASERPLFRTVAPLVDLPDRTEMGRAISERGEGDCLRAAHLLNDPGGFENGVAPAVLRHVVIPDSELPGVPPARGATPFRSDPAPGLSIGSDLLWSPGVLARSPSRPFVR